MSNNNNSQGLPPTNHYYPPYYVNFIIPIIKCNNIYLTEEGVKGSPCII